MDLINPRCVHFRLTVYVDNKVVMHQQPSTVDYIIPCLRVNGAELKTVDYFNYLGSIMTRCVKIDDEVAHRIFKASQTFSRPQNTMWNRHGLQMDIKWKI
nr:unnamed protein product [Spirometra erinaceieuropaei]